jgi:hypothetical protein
MGPMDSTIRRRGPGSSPIPIGSPGVRMAGAIFAALFILPVFSSSAQDAAVGTANNDDETQTGISREEWRQRVEEAKRRSKEAAIERRSHPERFIPIPEDPERIATERVLNDESLQPGDIVSTKRGLFVFRGRSDQPRKDDDFIPVPVR